MSTREEIAGRGYTIEDDLLPILKGDVAVPNFEESDIHFVANNLAAIGHSLTPHWGYAKLTDGSKNWTFYFLRPAPGAGQIASGNYLSGEGYMLIYGRGYPAHAKAGHFSVCKHEKEDAFGANHSRGWHPGSCKLCGLNMTYDSGD